MVWLPEGEKTLKVCLFVSTGSSQSTNVTDTQKDGHLMTAKVARQ